MTESSKHIKAVTNNDENKFAIILHIYGSIIVKDENRGI